MNTRTHLLRLNLPAAAVLALLACAMLTGCSVQKRTTAPGWHVEKASGWFRQAGPSNSLTPQVKPDLPTLTRMDRLPPRALSWTTSTLPTDTSAVDAKVKSQVTGALRKEIRVREKLLMFPRGPLSAWRKAEAEKRHNSAEQICKEQGLYLSEVAPDEFARVEKLRYPSRDTMKELKRRKTSTVVVLVLLSIGAIAYFLYLLSSLLANPWGGG